MRTPIRRDGPEKKRMPFISILEEVHTKPILILCWETSKRGMRDNDKRENACGANRAEYVSGGYSNPVYIYTSFMDYFYPYVTYWIRKSLNIRKSLWGTRTMVFDAPRNTMTESNHGVFCKVSPKRNFVTAHGVLFLSTVHRPV